MRGGCVSTVSASAGSYAYAGGCRMACVSTVNGALRGVVQLLFSSLSGDVQDVADALTPLTKPRASAGKAGCVSTVSKTTPTRTSGVDVPRPTASSVVRDGCEGGRHKPHILALSSAFRERCLAASAQALAHAPPCGGVNHLSAIPSSATGPLANSIPALWHLSSSIPLSLCHGKCGR